MQRVLLLLDASNTAMILPARDALESLKDAKERAPAASVTDALVGGDRRSLPLNRAYPVHAVPVACSARVHARDAVEAVAGGAPEIPDIVGRS